MTISYQRDVASSTAGGFTRLLFKWKGSLYKLICRELILFLVVYALLGVIYRQLMNESQQKLFESVVKYFDAFLNLIPLSFVLGFYVSYVASRWWQQFLAIPWPDKLFHSIACYIEGFDDDSRMLRRSLMRWMNLAMILVLRSISSAVKQRFPTLDHVVEAGFMTVNEKKLFESVPANEFNTYWVPCTWFVYRLQEATKHGRLLNQYALENIMREFCEFRAKCGLLWCYDWVSIPMVYTQVVTLATYVFFIFTIIGRQKLNPDAVPQRMPSGRIPLDIDLYIPIFTVLQFFFFMGLLKVAEQLINPFGDDDEDFELNWLIDRHMKASFLGCDILMNPDRIPPLVKDYYWDKQDCPIPYTEAAMQFKKKTYRGSADDMKVPEDKCHMVLPEIEEEAEEDTKLSLTSLLLESSNIMTNIGLGNIDAPDNGREEGDPSPMGYGRRGPAASGAWRNGNGGGLGATPGSQRQSLAARASSLDSLSSVPCEDDEERRGSLTTARRGSRLSDIIQMQERRKAKKGRYRDKQGFTWRPFTPQDEELPVPRAPSIHVASPTPGPLPYQSFRPTQPPPNQPTNQPPNQSFRPVQPPPAPSGNSAPPIVPLPVVVPPVPPTTARKQNGTGTEARPAPRTAPIPRKPSSPGEDPSVARTPGPPTLHSPRARAPPLGRQDSSRSVHSENSFQTASSDPAINFIPRQISESYQQVPGETAALERKTSVRALQQQHYSALLGQPGTATGPVPSTAQPKMAPGRTQSRGPRS